MQLYKDKTAEKRAGSFFSNESRAKSFFPKQNTNEQVFRLQSAGTFDVLSGRTSVAQLCSADPNCPYPDPCPVHNTYTQATDPTMRRHMRRGESYVGEKAMEMQMRRKAPPAKYVRGKTYEGSGLHEGIPTNYASNVAEDQIPGMIGGQSGIRTSTKMTFFASRSPYSPQVVAHSGALRKGSRLNAFFMTENQAAMHDALRAAYDEIAANYVPKKECSNETYSNVAKILKALINQLAPGYLLSSIMIEKRYGSTCPVVCELTGEELDSDDDVNELASAVGNAREEVKHRYADYCARHRIRDDRPPSPPRSPFRPDGSGGGYTGDARYTPRPFPYCEDRRYPGDIERRIANETSYIMQPLRDYDRYYDASRRRRR